MAREVIALHSSIIICFDDLYNFASINLTIKKSLLYSLFLHCSFVRKRYYHFYNHQKAPKEFGGGFVEASTITLYVLKSDFIKVVSVYVQQRSSVFRMDSFFRQYFLHHGRGIALFFFEKMFHLPEPKL